MIDYNAIQELMGKSAADQGQSAGSQAMAAAAAMARPSWAPPLPKPIEEQTEDAASTAEVAKMQAQAQKDQERQREELAKKDKEIAELRERVSAEHISAMKADAMREAAVEHAKHTSAIAKERLDADKEITNMREKGLQDAQKSIQQLAAIRERQSQAEGDALKRVADIEAKHTVELAQQKAKASEELSKMRSDSYVKATEQARQLQDKYMADARKQMDAQRAAMPAFSPALKQQLGGAIKAVSGFGHRKFASVWLPVPGASPVLVKEAMTQQEAQALMGRYGGFSKDINENAIRAATGRAELERLQQEDPRNLTIEDKIKLRDLPEELDALDAFVGKQKEEMMANMRQGNPDLDMSKAEDRAKARERQAIYERYNDLNEERSRYSGLGWLANSVNNWLGRPISKEKFNNANNWLRRNTGLELGSNESALERMRNATRRGEDGNGNLNWKGTVQGRMVENTLGRAVNMTDPDSTVGNYARMGYNLYGNMVSSIPNDIIGAIGSGVDAIGNIDRRATINADTNLSAEQKRQRLRDLSISPSSTMDWVNIGLAPLAATGAKAGLGWLGSVAKAPLTSTASAASLALRTPTALLGGARQISRAGRGLANDVAQSSGFVEGIHNLGRSVNNSQRTGSGLVRAWNTVADAPVSYISKPLNSLAKKAPRVIDKPLEYLNGKLFNGRWQGGKISNGIDRYLGHGLNGWYNFGDPVAEHLSPVYTPGGLGLNYRNELYGYGSFGQYERDGALLRRRAGEPYNNFTSTMFGQPLKGEGLNKESSASPQYIPSADEMEQASAMTQNAREAAVGGRPYESTYKPPLQHGVFSDGTLLMQQQANTVATNNPYAWNKWLARMKWVSPWVSMLTEGKVNLVPNVTAPPMDPSKTIRKGAVTQLMEGARNANRGLTMSDRALDIYQSNIDDLADRWYNTPLQRGTFARVNGGFV